MQGLLVDFAGFPAMLVQLVQHCLEAPAPAGPKFVLVLNTSGPQVKRARTGP